MSIASPICAIIDALQKKSIFRRFLLTHLEAVAKVVNMARERVEFVSVFGGGCEVWVGGEFFGMFPSRRAARKFMAEG